MTTAPIPREPLCSCPYAHTELDPLCKVHGKQVGNVVPMEQREHSGTPRKEPTR